MSQNLVGVIKEHKGKYYLWPETFEEVVGDAENGNKRYLYTKDAFGPYDSYEQAEEQGTKDFNKKYGEYGFEYGTGNYNVIDGVRLVVVEGAECETKEYKIEHRIQNLESFMETQSAINKKIVKALENHDILKDEEVYKDEFLKHLSKLVEEGCVGKIRDYVLNTKVKLGAKLSEEKSKALVEILSFINKHSLGLQTGGYCIANWFEIQPMKINEVDEEVGTENTTLHYFPFYLSFTLEESETIIREQLENLEILLG